MMPLLDICDKMRARNRELSLRNGPLGGYKALIDELLEKRGLIQLILHIIPTQLLV
jgi:hypothetical protein